MASMIVSFSLVRTLVYLGAGLAPAGDSPPPSAADQTVHTEMAVAQQPASSSAQLRRLARYHGLPFVLVRRGEGAAFAGGPDQDLNEAASANSSEDEYLWVRRGDQRLVITAAGALASLRALADERMRLVNSQAELGARQVELRNVEGRLAAFQLEISQRWRQVVIDREELSDQQIELQTQPIRNVADLSPNPARSRPTLSEATWRLAFREEAIGRARLALAQRESELDRKQNQIIERQREIARYQRSVGHRLLWLSYQEQELGRRTGEEVERITLEALGAAGGQ